MQQQGPTRAWARDGNIVSSLYYIPLVFVARAQKRGIGNGPPGARRKLRGLLYYTILLFAPSRARDIAPKLYILCSSAQKTNYIICICLRAETRRGVTLPATFHALVALIIIIIEFFCAFYIGTIFYFLSIQL